MTQADRIEAKLDELLAILKHPDRYVDASKKAQIVKAAIQSGDKQRIKAAIKRINK